MGIKLACLDTSFETSWSESESSLSSQLSITLLTKLSLKYIMLFLFAHDNLIFFQKDHLVFFRIESGALEQLYMLKNGALEGLELRQSLSIKNKNIKKVSQKYQRVTKLIKSKL